MSAPRTIGYWTATATVVANIVGTGVFTSLGFQLLGLGDPAALLLLWLVGGVIAIGGALAYGEIAASIPESGGERTYLARLWHPVAGQMAGWVSVTVGFSAPIALAAMALGRFSEIAIGVPARGIAIGAIAGLAALHALAPSAGRRLQVGATALKVALLLAFVALAAAAGDRTGVVFGPTPQTGPELLSPAFAVSLIYVGYAYTGWNAAVYFGAEVQDAERTVPRALAHGTLLVAACYVALHWAFLRAAPMDAMRGKVEVGAIAAEAMLGPVGGRVMAGALALLLLSTISAMCLAGPRALEATVGELRGLAALAERDAEGRPVRAALLQGLLAIGFVLADAFETTLTYSGAVLALCSMATVAGVYRLRARERRGVLAGGRGAAGLAAPALYLVASAWTLIHVVQERPLASVGVVVTAAVVGLLSFAFGRKARS